MHISHGPYANNILSFIAASVHRVGRLNTSLTTFTTQRKFVWFMEKLRLPVIDVGEKRFLQSRPRRQPPVWENTFYDAVA